MSVIAAWACPRRRLQLRQPARNEAGQARLSVWGGTKRGQARGYLSGAARSAGQAHAAIRLGRHGWGKPTRLSVWGGTARASPRGYRLGRHEAGQAHAAICLGRHEAWGKPTRLSE